MQLLPGTAGAAGVFHQLLLQPGVGGHAASPCPGPARRPQRHTAPPARCGAILSTIQLLPGTAGAAGVFHEIH
ncbi:hypothetical protein AKG95_28915 (plasmid) [Janthinobacterium lividum]|uniref:Uncharacterized protein n=1 Tax=Janthinobacterium lividum TaxID=29581 RepID=A0A1S1U0X2_9BURK|nr:hypothetical protein [Janthinobacterium lividum]OHV93758.1 hypothetical protein AKG95_28915 [Janthinobacterium lividum]